MPVHLLALDLALLAGTKNAPYNPQRDLDVTPPALREQGERQILVNGQAIIRKINRLAKEYQYKLVSYSEMSFKEQNELFNSLQMACQTQGIPYPNIMNSWKDINRSYKENVGKEAILDAYKVYYGDRLEPAESVVFDGGYSNVQLAIARKYQGYCIDENLSLDEALQIVIGIEQEKARAAAVQQEESDEEVGVGSSSSEQQHKDEKKDIPRGQDHLRVVVDSNLLGLAGSDDDCDLVFDDIEGAGENENIEDTIGKGASRDDKGKEKEDAPEELQFGYFTEDADPNRLHPLFLTYDEAVNPEKAHLVYSDHLPILLSVRLSHNSYDTLGLISWNTLGKNAFSGLHRKRDWETDDEAQERYKRIALALVKMIEKQDADCILLQETEIALLKNAQVGADGKLFIDYMSELGWSILHSDKAGAALVTLASPRLQNAEIEYDAIAGWNDPGIERQGLRYAFTATNQDGQERLVKIHNTWGRFSDTPEQHEEYYRSILSPPDSEQDDVICIVAGDTNNRFGGMFAYETGACNLTTALVPHSFVKADYDSTLPNDHKVQVADYPDGGFYCDADGITQVQHLVIDPSTGHVVRDKIHLVPGSMAKWNQNQRMVLRLDDSCAGTFQRQNELRQKTGDEGAILAPAYNANGELTWGIAFTSGKRELRDSFLAEDVEFCQKRSHPVGESDTMLRPHLYAEPRVLDSAIDKQQYRVVSQQRSNETGSSESQLDWLAGKVPDKRSRFISRRAQTALFVTTGLLATLAVSDMLFGGISYALDFLPHIVTSMPFLAALAGVAGLALLGLGVCAIIKVAECGKSEYGDTSVGLLNDWDTMESQQKLPDQSSNRDEPGIVHPPLLGGQQSRSSRGSTSSLSSTTSQSTNFVRSSSQSSSLNPSLRPGATPEGD